MKAMPQLRFSIRYDVRRALPNGWTGTAPLQLANSNAYSSHGDSISGWTEEGGEGLVKATAEKQKYISMTGARGKDGDKMACKTTDADRPTAPATMPRVLRLSAMQHCTNSSVRYL